MPQRLSVGLSLSLSGAYAAMGRQAEAAIKLFVDDLNAAGGVNVGGRTRELALRCHDDQSDARRCAEIFSALCGPERVDLLLGPYSSRLARAAAPIAEAAGMVMLNHGGADDGLYANGSSTAAVSIVTRRSRVYCPRSNAIASTPSPLPAASHRMSP